MKRLWIGVVLLVLMLIGGITMLLLSHRFYSRFSDTLESAADAALSENWSDAEKLAQEATRQWQRYHRFLASFTDHEPVENVELLLTRLTLFQNARLTVDFVDTCRSLSHLSEAIDESHNLKWWSVL